jgi:hypothetical protein
MARAEAQRLLAATPTDLREFACHDARLAADLAGA